MRKAILWDLDGTVADSLAAILQAADLALADAGLPAMREDRLRPLIGTPIRTILALQGVPQAQLDRCVATYRARYDPRSAKPIAGVPALLRAAHAQGFLNAVVTTKADRLAAQALEGIGLREVFAVVIGDDGARPLKPHPQPVLDACAALGVAPEAATMVGDTMHDLEAARAAGVRFVAVPWGYGDLDGFRRLGADVAKDVDDLAARLGVA